MPKIFVLRHQLAEQQARLSGDIKTTITEHSEEVKMMTNAFIIKSISACKYSQTFI